MDVARCEKSAVFDRVLGTDPQSDTDSCRVIATTMLRICDMPLAM
jgi:hypothetical protein